MRTEVPAQPAAPTHPPPDRPRGGRGLLVLGFLLAALSLVLGIFYGVLKGKAYRVPSESMSPTLVVGERLITTRTSSPSRGDIVVFYAPAGADQNVCGVEHSERSICPRPTEDRSQAQFIKRVVAIPGDRVKLVDGRLYVNARPQREPFARTESECAICDLPEEVTVPKDHYLMLGDNRASSADSREWGPVPSKWLVGKVRLRYWPTSRFGSP